MSDGEEKVTGRQYTLLASLLTERTIGDAAKSAKVSDATARRWLALPHVQRAYMLMRRQTVDSALTAVQGATGAAVATLVQCMAPTMPPAVRVRAATAILDTAVRTVELSDLAERVAQLEKIVRERQAQQERLQGRRRYA